MKTATFPKLRKLCSLTLLQPGAVVGTSTVTTYVESTSGIAAGGRTGLTSTVTGLCFALALFLSPIVGLVPSAATAPILIIVGVMMCGSLKDIDWADIDVAIPCFLTVAGMPFFYSITDGLAFGFIAYHQTEFALVFMYFVRALSLADAAADAAVFISYNFKF